MSIKITKTPIKLTLNQIEILDYLSEYPNEYVTQDLKKAIVRLHARKLVVKTAENKYRVSSYGKQIIARKHWKVIAG